MVVIPAVVDFPENQQVKDGEDSLKQSHTISLFSDLSYIQLNLYELRKRCFKMSSVIAATQLFYNQPYHHQHCMSLQPLFLTCQPANPHDLHKLKSDTNLNPKGQLSSRPVDLETKTPCFPTSAAPAQPPQRSRQLPSRPLLPNRIPLWHQLHNPVLPPLDQRIRVHFLVVRAGNPKDKGFIWAKYSITLRPTLCFGGVTD